MSSPARGSPEHLSLISQSPFSREIAEHLRSAPKQITSRSSKFLETVERFNREDASQDELVASAIREGFRYVFDAFHRLPGGDLTGRFFEITKGESAKLFITDDLLSLAENVRFSNLEHEVEARWKLVETAWQLGVTPSLIVVRPDELSGGLLLVEQPARKVVTSSRAALIGYQKGKCFYCFRDIVLERTDSMALDVDHFFPIILTQYQTNSDLNLNGVWNLVLACRNCNRGPSGKFARVPDLSYLERLNKRNEFLIASHHPLRETLMAQTGISLEERHQFLQGIDSHAIGLLIHRWKAEAEGPPFF